MCIFITNLSAEVCMIVAVNLTGTLLSNADSKKKLLKRQDPYSGRGSQFGGNDVNV